MSRIKSHFSIPVILLIASLLISACGGNASAESEATDPAPSSNVRVVKVNSIAVTLQSFEEIIPVTGVLSSPRDASLSAQTSGTIVSLLEVGARVEQGDVVAKLDDRLIKAALEQAKASRLSAVAAVDLAKDLFKRQEPLFRDSIISAIEFEGVRSRLSQSQALLAQMEAAVSGAQQQLENTLIRAPFAGAVEQRMAEKGEQVSPGMPVLRIVDTSNLKIQAGVPERYASDIRVGTEATVSLKAYNGDMFDSRITVVGNVIDPQSRTFLIEVSVSNKGRNLKPEMIVDVLITRRVLKNQIVLPQTAIILDENGSSVYTVDESGPNKVAKLVQVETGASYGGQTVITSGLEAGIQVITVGQTMVSEGDLVEIVADAS
ncbi:MAG: efflux RND transporter periplasmic adaptor subunit [Bacteroidetes bacterium]|nr:efflux RND transporter periplasmic adaptor subunit [Bacteroidota bacterium]